jgi:hypothetical protein
VTDASDPYKEKQLDYEHQSRTYVGGKAWRKVRTQLPSIERQEYRRALDRATQRAEYDEESAEIVADELRSIKRSHFRRLFYRREGPLGKVLPAKIDKRKQMVGGKKKRREKKS